MTHAANERPAKLFALRLFDERYVVSVDDVREVVGALRVSRVPGTPAAVLGLTNLRGRVLPVLDLARLGAATPDPDQPSPTTTLVVEVGSAWIGVAVSEAVGVLTVGEPPLELPKTTTQIPREFLPGVHRVGDLQYVELRLTALLQASGLLDPRAAGTNAPEKKSA